MSGQPTGDTASVTDRRPNKSSWAPCPPHDRPQSMPGASRKGPLWIAAPPFPLSPISWSCWDSFQRVPGSSPTRSSPSPTLAPGLTGDTRDHFLKDDTGIAAETAALRATPCHPAKRPSFPGTGKWVFPLTRPEPIRVTRVGPMGWSEAELLEGRVPNMGYEVLSWGGGKCSMGHPHLHRRCCQGHPGLGARRPHRVRASSPPSCHQWGNCKSSRRAVTR